MNRPVHMGVLLLLLMAANAPGSVVSYECNSFPEEAGWEVVAVRCNPDLWLFGGWYLQHVEPWECGPPPGGDGESLSRSLVEFAGQDGFFIQWRMQTDGDRSEIPGTSPAGLSAWGLFGVNYHFTIARDKVRFLRHTQLPIVWADIEPDVPHTYRLELFGGQLYVWYIDDEVIAAGVPEGWFPTSDSNINWWASVWYLESTTQWDYIRYGTIPEPGSGDFDSEGDVDLRDLFYFDECLANGGPGTEAGPGCVWADMDFDNDVDFHDYAAFQNSFTGAL